MKKLNKILIIDDELARGTGKFKTAKENFINRWSLKEVNLHDEPTNDKKDEYSAEAVFISGQIPNGSKFKNDMEQIIEAIELGYDVEDVSKPYWSLVLLDLWFDTGNIDDRDNYWGYEVSKMIKEKAPYLPVFQLSQEDIQYDDWQRKTIHSKDFIPKDADLALEHLKNRVLSTEQIEGIKSKHGVETYNRYIYKEGLKEILYKDGLIADENFVGRSGKFLNYLKEIRNIEITKKRSGRTEFINTNVLLLGKPGVGKGESVSYFANQLSQRMKKLEVEFQNLSGIPDDFITTEFFGIERDGGNLKKSEGVVHRANQKGILFLDEIGDVKENHKPPLLTFIESRKYTQLYTTRGTLIAENIILFAATNQIESIKSRDDFYQRLSEEIYYVPSLEERKSDIGILINHFIGTKYSFEDEALEMLKDIIYEKKIRVRVLKIFIKNIIKRVGSYGDKILKEHVQEAKDSYDFNQVETFIDENNDPKSNYDPQPPPTKLIEPKTIDELIEVIEKFQFSDSKKENLGKYKKLNKALKEVLIKYYANAYFLENKKIKNAVELIKSPETIPSTDAAKTFIEQLIKYIDDSDLSEIIEKCNLANHIVFENGSWKVQKDDSKENIQKVKGNFLDSSLVHWL